MREGRPREMGSQERGKNISLYFDPKQLKSLDIIRKHRSLSSVVREAVDQYIQSHS